MDKTTMDGGEPTPPSSQKKTILEKLLLVFVILLLITVAFLSYMLVTVSQKENKTAPKDHAENPRGSFTTCITDSCILNAADLLTNMDSNVDPCDDFYSFACGSYDKSTSIPSSSKSVHVLLQLQNENKEFLKALIENPKLRKHYSENIPITKVFHAYDSCMDIKKLDSVGVRPVEQFIEEIGGSNITSARWNSQKYNVYDAMAKAKQRSNIDLFFKVGVWIDPKNSSHHVFFIWSSTLTLKYSSYLPHESPQDNELRLSYKNYMENVMKNVHTPNSNVAFHMKEVYKLERRLAKIYSRPSSHAALPFPIVELSKYTKFDWLSHFRKLTAEIGYSPSNNDVVLVQSQEFLRRIIQLINNTDIHILSNYIAWNILQSSISALPTSFGRIRRDFQNSIQSRSTEQPKRWQSCLEILSEALNKALSFLYVDQKFSEQSRERAYEIFDEIRREFIENLRSKSWMDNTTKNEAKEKAKGINFLVGYNDDLKNPYKLGKYYGELRVNRSDFFQTFLNLRSFRFKSDINKLLNPVQKDVFDEMTSDANAYYSRQENKISFMAGILQRPFYDRRNSRASNYGALGMFVGHELTHAFDSRGHKYDKKGDLRNWWTEFSLKNFHEKKKCFTEQYDKFTIFGERVRGAQTLGESIADNGGLKLAYMAFKRSQRRNGKEPRLPGLNLTNDQVFFLSFAQSWCSKYTEDGIKEMIDYRVPMMFRVTGVLRNSPDFSTAYHCPSGTKMNPRLKCDLW